MKGPELLLLHDYWAATLERLGQLEGARRHALLMLQADPGSHKGYLRHGKILRLLERPGAAVETYQEGLRSAATGHDEIAGQLRLAMIAVEARESGSRDPFTRLPPHVLQRVLTLCTEGAGWRALERIALLSRHSAAQCRRFYLEHPHSLTLVKKCTRNDIRRVLQSGKKYTSLVISGQQLALLAKTMSEPPQVTCNMSRLHIEGPVSDEMIPAGPLACLGTVNTLTIAKQPLLSRPQALVAMAQLMPRVHTLVIRECGAFALASQDHWPSLCSLKLHGSVATEVDEGIWESLEHFSCHGWTGIWDDASPFDRMHRLTSLSTDAPFLAHLPRLLLQRGEAESAPLRCLSISFQAGMQSPQCLNHLALLSQHLTRLRLEGHVDAQCGGRRPMTFPSLRHLYLGDVGPFLLISTWQMPRLQSFCARNSSSLRREQLPSTPSLKEVLIGAGDVDLPVPVFQELIRAFQQGRIRVLGVADAHRLFQKDGHARLEQLAAAQARQALLYWREEVERRIGKHWPGL